MSQSATQLTMIIDHLESTGSCSEKAGKLEILQLPTPHHHSINLTDFESSTGTVVDLSNFPSSPGRAGTFNEKEAEFWKVWRLDRCSEGGESRDNRLITVKAQTCLPSYTALGQFIKEKQVSDAHTYCPTVQKLFGVCKNASFLLMVSSPNNQCENDRNVFGVSARIDDQRACLILRS